MITKNFFYNGSVLYHIESHHHLVNITMVLWGKSITNN